MRTVFANHTHLAITVDEWIEALRIAIKESNNQDLAETRIAFAKTHSWEHSVKVIYDVIIKHQD